MDITINTKNQENTYDQVYPIESASNSTFNNNNDIYDQGYQYKLSSTTVQDAITEVGKSIPPHGKRFDELRIPYYNYKEFCGIDGAYSMTRPLDRIMATSLSGQYLMIMNMFSCEIFFSVDYGVNWQEVKNGSSLTYNYKIQGITINEHGKTCFCEYNKCFYINVGDPGFFQINTTTGEIDYYDSVYLSTVQVWGVGKINDFIVFADSTGITALFAKSDANLTGTQPIVYKFKATTLTTQTFQNASNWTILLSGDTSYPSNYPSGFGYSIYPHFHYNPNGVGYIVITYQITSSGTAIYRNGLYNCSTGALSTSSNNPVGLNAGNVYFGCGNSTNQYNLAYQNYHAVVTQSQVLYYNIYNTTTWSTVSWTYTSPAGTITFDSNSHWVGRIRYFNGQYVGFRMGYDSNGTRGYVIGFSTNLTSWRFYPFSSSKEIKAFTCGYNQPHDYGCFPIVFTYRNGLYEIYYLGMIWTIENTSTTNTDTVKWNRFTILLNPDSIVSSIKNNIQINSVDYYEGGYFLEITQAGYINYNYTCMYCLSSKTFNEYNQPIGILTPIDMILPDYLSMNFSGNVSNYPGGWYKFKFLPTFTTSTTPHPISAIMLGGQKYNTSRVNVLTWGYSPDNLTVISSVTGGLETSLVSFGEVSIATNNKGSLIIMSAPNTSYVWNNNTTSEKNSYIFYMDNTTTPTISLTKSLTIGTNRQSITNVIHNGDDISDETFMFVLNTFENGVSTSQLHKTATGATITPVGEPISVTSSVPLYGRVIDVEKSTGRLYFTLADQGFYTTDYGVTRTPCPYITSPTNTNNDIISFNNNGFILTQYDYRKNLEDEPTPIRYFDYKGEYILDAADEQFLCYYVKDKIFMSTGNKFFYSETALPMQQIIQ